VTTYPHRIHVGRPHVNLWFVVVALAAALVGLGAWVLVDRYAGGGGATHDATTLLDDFNATGATNDGAAASALLTSDAVMWSAETKIVGRKAIADQIATTPGLLVERVAPVTVKGDYATTFIKFTAGGVIKNAPMIMTVQLKGGKIFRIWTFALGQTAPFNNTATPSF
jgi:hypothetical protein